MERPGDADRAWRRNACRREVRSGGVERDGGGDAVSFEGGREAKLDTDCAAAEWIVLMALTTCCRNCSEAERLPLIARLPEKLFSDHGVRRARDGDDGEKQTSAEATK